MKKSFCLLCVVLSLVLGFSCNKASNANEAVTVADQKESEKLVLKDGVYDIEVESSASMFRIEACTLTVANGKMTARMQMGGTGYLYVFLGTGEEALAADEKNFIAFEEVDGVHYYTIDVVALDSEIACAAFSKNKETWYDRTLVFKSETLPFEAFKDGVIATVRSLKLEDGLYSVHVRLEGGTGRTSIQGETELKVSGGKATAKVVFNSRNYDYMKVAGQKYDAVNTEKTSEFEIPVPFFNFKMQVLADTVAMSTPHEIPYALVFDSATILRK